jgi:hypothetical protein
MKQWVGKRWKIEKKIKVIAFDEGEDRMEGEPGGETKTT